MAKVNLIEGEKAARQGTFIDLAKAAEPAFKAAELKIAEKKAEEEAKRIKDEAKVDAAEQKTATYLGKMTSNIDLTKLSDDQTQVVQKWAAGQKDLYLEAAKKLGNLKSTDPGYLEQVDIMNGVNRAFVSANASIKNYVKDRIKYKEDFDKGYLSKGDATRYAQASDLYDPSATFSMSGKGSMFFGEGKDSINYNDWTPPAAPAHTQATAIFNIVSNAHDVSFSSGQAITSDKLKVYRGQLNELIGKNPDIIKSLAKDNLLTDYREELPEYSGKPEDYEEWKNNYIDKILEGVKNSSKQGVMEHKVKNRTSTTTTYRGYTETELQQQFDSKRNITKGNTVYKYITMPKGEFNYKDGKYTYKGGEKDGKAVSNVLKQLLEYIDAIYETPGVAATFTPENPFEPGYLAINPQDNTYQNNFLKSPMELASILVTKTKTNN